MKITMQQFEEFEKAFLFDQIKNPTYRLGQAFLNTYPKISLNLENGGDLSYMHWHKLWETKDRAEVLKLIDQYITKQE